MEGMCNIARQEQDHLDLQRVKVEETDRFSSIPHAVNPEVDFFKGLVGF